ncbi:hypothetical protein [Rhizobacter sp. Root1221]|uniref:hypothetical protein n=1 Tax=Rhizobacter sp. Root1221 TaxID=1736433 RepID=UPI0006FCA060|nr:hypothetical protein [Rhizobacter sp. Root1221]KQW00115.1 hypothetical protein ASC87_19045 [Rhizobacter sp. Root1221]
MLKWLARLTGPHDPDTRDAHARLQVYPPYDAPHAGPQTRWTLAQAQDNLDHLMRHRAHRMVVLGDWLRPEGIDIRPALVGGNPQPLLDALHQWANARWPAWHDPAIAHRDVWLRGHRSGNAVVYSLLLDVTLLLGELIVQRHDGYRWALDLDEENGRDGMRSYRRAVLELPARGHMPAPIVLDLEDMVVSRYLHPEYVSNQFRNVWAEVVGSAISGDQEAAWAEAPGAPR